MASPNNAQFHNDWEGLRAAVRVDQTRLAVPNFSGLPADDLRIDALPSMAGADLLELLVPIEWGEASSATTITLSYRGETAIDTDLEYTSRHLVKSEVIPVEVVQAVERAIRKLERPS